MTKPRVYIDPSAGEIDCAYYLSSTEYARGFLRLPSSPESGRLRLVEAVPTLDPSTDLFDPIPVSLLDGSSGTPACLLDCFVSSHRMSMPTPPAFPLELLVNQAIVGSDDADQRYERATVRCERLLDFLEFSSLAPERVASAESTTEDRAHASGDGWALTLREAAETRSDETSATMQWYGEITLEGESRSLQEWGQSLNEVLPLFAFLVDKPLAPGQIYADEDSNRVDLYASWSERSAPTRTVPLFTLRRVENRFDQLVERWVRLLDKGRDLVDHVVEFQLHRQRHTLPDLALLLVRCLELFHAYSERFESLIRPKAEHRALVKAVMNGLSEEVEDQHGDWIKSALSEANRKRLVAQIKDILEDLGPDVVGRCFIANAAEFASVAKATRNYFTHPTGEKPQEVPQGRDLLILVQRLWFVVRACVLMKQGFARDEVAAALERSSQRHYLLK